MKKLYIDIDGVLLRSGHRKLAPGAEDLIDVTTKNFDCYWLSSYCKGDAAPVLRLLSRYVDEETIEKLKSVKATNWLSWKTEGIDLESDFIWLEDHPMRAEMQVLKAHDKLDRLIVVDLNRKDELKGIIQLLKQ